MRGCEHISDDKYKMGFLEGESSDTAQGYDMSVK